MSMPSAVRHINEVRVLNTLYRHGALRRADLARELDLTRATVGNLIAGLITQGLVLEGQVLESAPQGSTGRPGQLVLLNAGHAAFIGADIGVGHLSVVALDLAGQVIHSRFVQFRGAPGQAEPTIDAMARMVRECMQQLPPGQAVQGICLTVPGLVDRNHRVVRAPVLEWLGVPALRMLAERLDYAGAMRSENDANAFAAAELFGRSPPASAEALFVYLDAGVGGGLVSRGRLMRGEQGHAGEVGHIHLGEHGFDPAAAVDGSLESFVGREAVLARFRTHGGRADSFDEFLASLSARSGPALATLEEWAWWLGRGLASLVAVLDPGAVVLGGPLAVLYDAASSEVQASIARHCALHSSVPPVRVSALGLNVCALGGATIMHHERLALDEKRVFGAAQQQPPERPLP